MVEDEEITGTMRGDSDNDLVSELKIVFERQNSLRPIFGVLFRVNRRERQHASPLRRLLAEAGIEYSQLQVCIN